MAFRPIDAKTSDRAYYVLYGMTLIAALMMTGYLSARVLMVLTGTGYSFADGLMAVLLLAAELFIAMHAVGYFANLVKCGWRQASIQPMAFARHSTAPVAVVIAAFNELEHVLDATLSAARAMDYPHANLYLLDDSTKPEFQEGARRVAEKYGARLLHRTNRAGYKAGAINDLIPHLTEPYLALLDADQKPQESWLKEMVSLMEARPELGLVQTPQHYINEEGLPVCEAATYQQGVFYEYICEGKSYSNAMFCCGSNALIRVEALRSIEAVRNGRVNYFDERSVTEDYATSFLLHLKGWATEYVNHPYAVGMGPETLPAYFTQQMRWAMGCESQARPIIREFVRNPRALTPAQWWEYWLVATYYFTGYSNFMFLIAPICFVLFDVQPVRTNSLLYLAFFVPYVIFAMNLLFFTMGLRRYGVKGVWLSTALNFSTFWIYMKAGVVAVFGLKRAFGVTPKGYGGAIPLRRLWMELTMFGGSVVASAVCLYHLFRGDAALPYLINGIWATYHAILLSTLFFHFNRRVDIPERERFFEPARLAA